ncbi:MAG: HAD family hydrolase [Rhodospirillaceae bacterium]
MIFDVDGTLVDSTDFHVEAWQRAFARYGKHVTREAIHAQIGKGGDQLMPVFLAPEELERHAQALERYRVELVLTEYLPRVQPFPGVRRLFERIKRNGMRIVLATSAKAKELECHLQTLEVRDLIDGMTSADDAPHSKPCPDIFQAALALAHDVRPQDAIVVGDTPYDAQAAGRAGMRCIAVLSGHFPEGELRASGAIAVYRDVADLGEHYDATPFATPRVADAANDPAQP